MKDRHSPPKSKTATLKHTFFFSTGTSWMQIMEALNQIDSKCVVADCPIEMTFELKEPDDE
jgi:hypothetical protein